MDRKIKIYYDLDLVDFEHRGYLFELLKSKLRIENQTNESDERIQSAIDWVVRKEDADIWILPMLWNFYYSNKTESQAIDYCENANSLGKVVLSMSGGDQGITIPVPTNTIIYRQSGYRSKQKVNERSMPFLLSDPVGKFVENEESLFEKNAMLKPIVGFCGMAPHGKFIELKERLRIIKRNLASNLGISPFDKQEVLSSSNLRFDTLQIFKQDSRFTTNYIIRDKYRGGEQTAENRRKTTEEYYQNQLHSDLITCVRGGGNFSLRIYETLAMGRIPIFIDTDSPLPHISGKDWKDYLIWVDRKNIKKAPQLTLDWMKNKDMISQFRKNRQLWKEELSGQGFWLNQLQEFAKNGE